MPLGATQYPTSLDTDAELFLVDNGVKSPLAMSMTNTDTSLNVDDASRFPSSGGIIAVDAEILSYTGKTSNTLTGLSRGLTGTTASAHSIGAMVKLVIASQNHNVLKDAIIAIETELGTLPKSSYADVKARLDNLLDKTAGGTVTGALGVGSGAIDAAAILQVNSTTKGFLPPRMTTAERDAITSPPAGLVIFNTSTNKLNVFTTVWEAVTSA